MSRARFNVYLSIQKWIQKLNRRQFPKCQAKTNEQPIIHLSNILHICSLRFISKTLSLLSK